MTQPSAMAYAPGSRVNTKSDIYRLNSADLRHELEGRDIPFPPDASVGELRSLLSDNFWLSAVSEDDDAESPGTTVNGSVVKVGDSCADNSSCSGLANSNCFLGECTCLPGYYALQGNDTCYTELGGTCDQDSDCVRADDVFCLNKICACTAGSGAIRDNRRCKKMKIFNNTCSYLYPELCSSYGLTCGCLPDSASILKCICAQGYHYEDDDQLCWVSKGLNASCTDNKDCKVSIGSAICVESDEDDRMCACSPGTSVSADGQNCVSVTGLESACSTDDDCSPLGSYVKCYSGSCSCDTNYYKNPSTHAGEPLCLPGIGGKCSEYDCLLDNTSCSSFNVCSCDESFTPSEKEDRCLEVALEEGDNCTEHTQCSVKLGSSQCVDGACVCLEHYHYLNGSCWETRALGESCTSLSECLKESSQNSVECRNNKCQCGFKYKENNNACESNNDGILLRASNIFPLFLLSLVSIVF